jgi:hypothetical protein
LYPVATDLIKGDLLPDGNEVAEYCSPDRYDRETQSPAASAFIRKPDQPDLSVNRLQFYYNREREESVDCIRDEFINAGYGIKLTGRFVVLKVSAIKAAALKNDCPVDIAYTPRRQPPYPSHSSVYGLPDGQHDRRRADRIAAALVRLVTQDDIYPGALS